MSAPASHCRASSLQYGWGRRLNPRLTKQVEVRLHGLHQAVGGGVHAAQPAAAGMLKRVKVDTKADGAHDIERHAAQRPPHVHLRAAVGGGSQPVAQVAC